MRILLAFLLAFASVGSLVVTPASAQQFGYHPNCPSLEQARALFGVDVTLIGSEVGGCAWTFNTGDYGFLPVNLPLGWYATTAEADGLVYIQSGDGSIGRIHAKASTWRLIVAYPGLTLERQVELTKAYAPYAGYDPSIVVCRGCGQPPAQQQINPQPDSSGCPLFGGSQTQPIGDGGCVYRGEIKTASVPDGWWALSGNPPTRVDAGPVTGNQISFYLQ